MTSIHSLVVVVVVVVPTECPGSWGRSILTLQVKTLYDQEDPTNTALRYCTSWYLLEPHQQTHP